MSDDLYNARQLAEQVRFSGDTYRMQSQEPNSQTHSIKNHSYQNGLRISKDVTPSLYESLTNVYSRLHIPAHTVEAFIYASPTLQASCFIGNSSESIIQFSSSLVEILDDDEFAFVAGHELGHFLLRHGIDEYKDSLEGFMLQRFQEISADRVGLLASQSLDVAIKALMKTASGLTNRHLRFDVGSFVSQLKKMTTHTIHSNSFSSHPSIIIRCRALLWFSLHDSSSNIDPNHITEHLLKIDEQVQKDLSRYVNSSAKAVIQSAKTNLSIWMTTREIIQGGSFTKDQQILVSQTFDEETLVKLKNYLENISSAEIKNNIHLRITKAQKHLQELIPLSFQTELEQISRLAKAFSK